MGSPLTRPPGVAPQKKRRGHQAHVLTEGRQAPHKNNETWSRALIGRACQPRSLVESCRFSNRTFPRSSRGRLLRRKIVFSKIRFQGNSPWNCLTFCRRHWKWRAFFPGRVPTVAGRGPSRRIASRDSSAEAPREGGSGSEVSLTGRRPRYNAASGLRTKFPSPQTDRSRLQRGEFFGVGIPRARVRWVVFEERSQRRAGRGVARAPWRARDTGRLPEANEPACLHSRAGDRCSGPERRNKRA